MSTFRVGAETDLGVVIAQLAAKGRSIGEFVPAISEMLVAAVSDVFDAEGPGWEPLAEVTIELRRNRDKESIKILQDTGVLVGSVIGRPPQVTESGDVVAIEAVDGTSYGWYHTTGTSKMPRRDWTDLGPHEQPLLDDIAASILEHIG